MIHDLVTKKAFNDPRPGMDEAAWWEWDGAIYLSFSTSIGALATAIALAFRVNRYEDQPAHLRLNTGLSAGPCDARGKDCVELQ